MSVILYQNGLTEEFNPVNLTYTDSELIDIFKNHVKLKTLRLSEVPNTWCLWGEYVPINKNDDEYNELASNIIRFDVFSPIIFIHDTEINIDWKLTDPIINNGYEEFKNQLLYFLDDIAINILEDRNANAEATNQSSSLVIIEPNGVSLDKRLIYKFDLKKQTEEFFIHNNLIEFSNKIHEYLVKNYHDGDIFTIYDDKNIIIAIEDKDVKEFINKIIAEFQIRESYEKCSELNNIYKRWKSYKTKKSKSASNKNLDNKNNAGITDK